ncbi:hypothetical protein ACT7CW_24400 [Bacillus pacificus]
MGEFIKDPGGHKVTDPGVGWYNEPGGLGGSQLKYDPNPGEDIEKIQVVEWVCMIMEQVEDT